MIPLLLGGALALTFVAAIVPLGPMEVYLAMSVASHHFGVLLRSRSRWRQRWGRSAGRWLCSTACGAFFLMILVGAAL
jgi:hypothetical protein